MTHIKSIIMAISAVAILTPCIYFASDDTASIPVSGETSETQETDIITETEALSETSSETEELTFLEREKLTDPIFNWVDPYPDVENTDNLIGVIPDDELAELNKNRVSYYMATTDYPMYYFYISGRSEYDDTIVESKEHYDDASALFSGFPTRCFIWNMTTDACVIMHPVETYTVTIERTYVNEEDRKKMQAMGESPTYDEVRTIMAIDKCLWGNMEGNTEIYVVPGNLTYGFDSIMGDTDKTFVAFLWKHNKSAEYNEEKYQEYGTTIRGLFDYTDGTLNAYSQIADFARYDGMKAEEMIAAGEALAEKYPEIINWSIY